MKKFFPDLAKWKQVNCIADTYIDEENKNTNYGTLSFTRTGWKNMLTPLFKRYFTLAKFETISNMDKIKEAKLQITFKNLQHSASKITKLALGAYRITSTWQETTATWNNKPAWDDYNPTFFAAIAEPTTDINYLLDIQLSHLGRFTDKGVVLYIYTIETYPYGDDRTVIADIYTREEADKDKRIKMFVRY